ncbi:hypothetical protein [Dietzia massiliensis]|uniref:hypothetical protein n=1 Tax=Dietzia massiliensis TaxID=2697499 RepID=UPI001BCC26AD|nr:hypothetical protein [Dietzia massiliensis]MBS7546699.1 hypothetical protein [Dietzia massiliensis]
MQFRSPARRSLIALLGAAGLVAGSGVAAAQIAPMALPGTDDSTVQMAVGSGLATVEVDAADEDATVVTGTFTNDSDGPLTCSTPGAFGASDGGTVTDEALVDRSLAFLTGNILPSTGGLVDTGSLAARLGSGSLGSLGLGDPAAVELDAIQQAQDQARLAGHYGTAPGFTVAAGASEPWSATLSVPTVERTDFDAGALFTCTDENDQWYAFAGYEVSDDDDADDDGGSLSMGSLGS